MSRNVKICNALLFFSIVLHNNWYILIKEDVGMTFLHQSKHSNKNSITLVLILVLDSLQEERNLKNVTIS